MKLWRLAQKSQEDKGVKIHKIVNSQIKMGIDNVTKNQYTCLSWFIATIHTNQSSWNRLSQICQVAKVNQFPTTFANK